jgi:hypothetical protein
MRGLLLLLAAFAARSGRGALAFKGGNTPLVFAGRCLPASCPAAPPQRRLPGAPAAPCRLKMTAGDDGNLHRRPGDGTRSAAQDRKSGGEAPERAVGLGITMLPCDGKITVTAVSPYSFAKQSGCQIGDVLVSIDGEDGGGMPVHTLFQKLVGAVDSTTVMLLETPNGKQKMVTLRRSTPPPRIMRRAEDYSLLGQAYQLSGDWDKALLYCERDLEKAMLKDPPDLKAAAAFATLSGEAREALGQRESAIEMFQQAINIARVALDPMGEVLAFNRLVLAMTSHLADDVIFGVPPPAAVRHPRVRLLRLKKQSEPKAIRLLLPQDASARRAALQHLAVAELPLDGTLTLPQAGPEDGTGAEEEGGSGAGGVAGPGDEELRRREAWLSVDKFGAGDCSLVVRARVHACMRVCRCASRCVPVRARVGVGMEVHTAPARCVLLAFAPQPCARNTRTQTKTLPRVFSPSQLAPYESVQRSRRCTPSPPSLTLGPAFLHCPRRSFSPKQKLCRGQCILFLSQYF